MADPRSSTIYDYTSLRLHRDGRRVAQSDDNYGLSKHRRVVVKDGSGNWIAKDAGGLGTVKRYGRREAARDTDGEYVSIEGEEEGQEGQQQDEWLILEKERKISYRAQKRRDFDEDLDFLDDFQQTSSLSTFGEEPCLPAPSSDLLKSIHYFTATFYTERGELSNLGKLYRAEKKLRKERSKSTTRQKKKRRRVQKDAAADFCDEEDEEAKEDGEDDDDQEIADPSLSSTKTSCLPGRNKLRRARKKHQQDMYRVMDGSALMVLGMIVQEHVARLVRGRIPDGWEEEMAQAYEAQACESQEENEDDEAHSSGEDDDDGEGSGNERNSDSDEGSDKESDETTEDDDPDKGGDKSENDDDDEEEVSALLL